MVSITEEELPTSVFQMCVLFLTSGFQGYGILDERVYFERDNEQEMTDCGIPWKHVEEKRHT